MLDKKTHTASGAGALAQALRESRDARVFGRATFGMAEADTILPLRSGAVIRMAAGRLESPNGFSWASKGVGRTCFYPGTT
ncbi:S41 family peptidase [Delftia tsuruhatensis]|uniref:S41 family peptidase n=1 Tax=Delftia tsuruhatensis TaxID=180282 RepID=UPI003AEFF73D